MYFYIQNLTITEIGNFPTIILTNKTIIKLLSLKGAELIGFQIFPLIKPLTNNDFKILIYIVFV